MIPLFLFSLAMQTSNIFTNDLPAVRSLRSHHALEERLQEEAEPKRKISQPKNLTETELEKKKQRTEKIEAKALECRLKKLADSKFNPQIQPLYETSGIETEIRFNQGPRNGLLKSVLTKNVNADLFLKFKTLTDDQIKRGLSNISSNEDPIYINALTTALKLFINDSQNLILSQESIKKSTEMIKKNALRYI